MSLETHVFMILPLLSVLQRVLVVLTSEVEWRLVDPLLNESEYFRFSVLVFNDHELAKI